LIIATTLPTAIEPCECSGAATVVSAGVTMSSRRMLSKPTTLTSSGTLTPIAWKPLMSPIAIWSL